MHILQSFANLIVRQSCKQHVMYKGFIHEPTLARRWPHNSVIEREIRTLEELTRASHLGAGFHIVSA
jgi:hypothetical protein